MDAERILREAWRVIQREWRFLCLVALIIFSADILLALLVGGTFAGGWSGLIAALAAKSVTLKSALGSEAGVRIGLGLLMAMLLAPLLTGISAHAGKLALDGKTKDVAAPFHAALKQYVTFLLLSIVLAVVIGIGFMLLIIPGIIIGVLLALSPIIVAYEGLPIGEALKRAWALGRKYFWTILIVGAIVAAISFILSLLTSRLPIVSAYVSTLLSLASTLTLAVIYRHATK